MKNIIVFGAGDTGRIVYETLGAECIRYFADNYPKAESYFDIPVIDFESLKEVYHEDKNIVIIVASYDHWENICYQLSKNKMIRFFVWPKQGYIQQNSRQEGYHYQKLLEDYYVCDYKNIAIYAYGAKLLLLLDTLERAELLDRVRYVIRYEKENIEVPAHISVIESTDITAIEREIDLLLMDVRRDGSRLHDYVESRSVSFAVADCSKFDIFVKRKRIAEVYNKHRGERCFIVGNGPSLTMKDLDMLYRHQEICIGTNKIYHAFSRTAWRPDYYIAQDQLMMKQHAAELSSMNVGYKFIADRCPDFWTSEHSRGVIKFHIKSEAFVPNLPDFSEDFSAYSVEGATVTYSAIQLAAYMGFTEIYLIGVDFDYSGDMTKGENHFCPTYIGANDAYGPFAPERCILAYRKAEVYSRLHGFRIFNATRGGKLEEFERINLDGLFK